MENVKQEDSQVLKCAAKVYLQRMSNQFAFPILNYLMWKSAYSIWPIAELQRLDRETRNVIVENGAKRPLVSTSLMYLPRKSEGRGLKSVESEYKLINIKAAVKLYFNTDKTMIKVRDFEKKAEYTGGQSLTTDAIKYAEGLQLRLTLEYENIQNMREERWQGKLLNNR